MYEGGANKALPFILELFYESFQFEVNLSILLLYG